MEHFENLYPIASRSKEIEQILSFVTQGQSCQLISVPGAGRSTVFRLLAYNQKIQKHYLKKGLFLLIYINFAETPGFEAKNLSKVFFLAVLASLREQGEKEEPWTGLGKEIYAMFKEALSTDDPLVLFQAFKRVAQLLRGKEIIPVFLFDRFSEFSEQLKPDFFSQLKTLRNLTGGELTVVFSTHRPLEELLPASHWGDFYEFFVGNHIFVSLYDKVATDFRISVLEKEYGKHLEPKLKQQVIKLTGGLGKLVKLSTQILLQETSIPKELSTILLQHLLIKGSLLEIWQALTREEKQMLREGKTSLSITRYGLPFPLLSEFIKRNIVDQLVPKTIRFNEALNEIFFGDDPIEGLTAGEFRLLKYLIENPNRVMDRDEIIQSVWSDTKSQEGVSDEALDQMVYRVRRKIEDEADNPKHLLTVKGRGFRFIP